jgi:hypothetical protein
VTVQQSPQPPLGRRAVALVRAELARRNQRTATDANRASPDERVAQQAEHEARVRSPDSPVLVASDQRATITTTTGLERG